MDFRSLLNKIAEAEAPLPGAGQKGPTVAAAAGQDPTNPLNKASGQAAQPATSAEWKPTPEQEKWLGGADRQDPYVLNRMPGDKPPVSYFKDPADQATAKQMGFPEATKAAATTGQGAQPGGAAKPETQAKIDKLNQLLVQLAKTRSTNSPTITVPSTTSGQSAQPAKPGTTAGATSGSTAHKIDQNQDGTYTIHKKDGTSVIISPEGKVLSENTIAKKLVESFGYTVNEADLSMKQLGGGLASGAAKAGLAKAGAKTAAKLVPGAGSALSAIDAYNRWQEGDRSGAVIAALAGVGWLVPGPLGWMLGGSLDAANIARDFNKPDSAEPEDKPATSKADPKIIALQKFLKNQGADLGTTGPEKDGVDGIMGPKTRAAMDSIGLSESQKSQLDQMLAEAGFGAAWDVAKGLGKNAGKSIKNFAKGTLNPNVTPIPDLSKFGKATNVKLKAPGAAFKAGQAVGRNPKKSAATAIGLGGYLGSKSDSDLDTPVASADANGAKASVGNNSVSTSSSSSTSNYGSQAAQPVKYTPEQQQLMQQIKDTLTDLQLSAPNDPLVAKAFNDAKKTIELFTVQK